MTQEDKELLLKDLCARFPYQPLCKKVDTEDDFCECNGPLGYSLRDLIDNKIIIKPYLRPMSSITEEERAEFYKVGGIMSHKVETDTYVLTAFSPEAYDWLNKHHFDYRGLIPKGLAIKAPEEIYNK